MFARLSGVPWLLIEICAWSLVYGCVSGVFHGPLVSNRTNGWSSMTAQRDRAWVGIDVGKTHHWACVVDADGRKLLSIKVGNDEADVVGLIATASSQAKQLDWAVDIIGAPSALLLALLDRAGQPVRYASGRVVAAMSAAYTGEGKTDAKDAYVIAQTSMMRAGPNRDYYLKKRAYGATHTQAVIALARRRIDVLWALIRENRTWTAAPPSLTQAA